MMPLDFIPPTTSFVPGATDQSFQIDVPTCSFNPSIIRLVDSLILAWRAQQSGGVIYISELDETTFRVRKPTSLKLPGYPEDPRLFLFDGALWVSFTMPRNSGLHSVGIARLSKDLRVSELHHLQSPLGRPEKNWQFFEFKGDLFAIYLIHPHTIGLVDGHSLRIIYQTQTKFAWPFGMPRGGTPPIQSANEFFTFFHSHLVINGRRLYYAGIYAFNAKPPFQITRYCPEAIISAGHDGRRSGPLVVFPGGAILREERWIVAYGLHDVDCRLMSFPAADLLWELPFH